MNVHDIPKLRLGIEFVTSFLPSIQEKVHYTSLKIEKINCKWVIPTDAEANKVLLYFHGGGYAVGSVQTHQSVVTQICKHSKTKGLLFDYSLSPEHQFPTALEDAIRVYQYLLAQGYAPQQIAFGGDSAGGGLAMATMIWIRDKMLAPLPACYIALSPWMDLTCQNTSIRSNANTDVMLSKESLLYMASIYIGKEAANHRYISPLFAELEGLPPMYLQVCDAEILLDDSVLFAEKAKLAGVDVEIDIYEKLVHVWQTFWPFLKEGRAANKKLGIYVQQKLMTNRSW